MSQKTREGNKQATKTQFEATEKADVDLLEEVYDEDAIFTDPRAEIRGLDNLKEYAKMFEVGFPDLEFDIHEMAAEGDIVLTYWTVSGTFKGEFGGIPPTGNTFEVPGFTIDRFKDGKIIEEHNVWNRLSIVEQLGIDPADLAEDG